MELCSNGISPKLECSMGFFPYSLGLSLDTWCVPMGFSLCTYEQYDRSNGDFPCIPVGFSLCRVSKPGDFGVF